METEMNQTNTAEDDSSTSLAINDNYYAAVESPPPIEEVIWQKSPAIDDQNYEAVKSPAIQEDIWEKFEKQLKQTKELSSRTKLSLINIYHSIKSRLASRKGKVKVAIEKLEDEYRSVRQKLEKRNADLLNSSDQENQIFDLKSRVEKITVDIMCKEATEMINWKPVINGQFGPGPKAVCGGIEPHASKAFLSITCIARALVDGRMVPGKMVVDRRAEDKSKQTSCCLVIDGNCKQRKFTDFEYMAQPSFGTLVWKPASKGLVPTGAVVGGKTSDGEPLFVGRTEFKENDSRKHLIIGMVKPNQLSLLFLWDGYFRTSREYEVLCHIYD